MFFVIASVIKLLLTILALVNPLAAMNSQMYLEITIILVGFPAQIANKRPLARVQPQMPSQMRDLGKHFVTKLTTKRFFARVDKKMRSQVAKCCAFFPALPTVRPITFVFVQMNLKLGFGQTNSFTFFGPKTY